MIRDFTENDVDMEVVRKTAMAEALAIFNSASARHGRSYEQIYSVTEQSHIAERYMIEHEGYENDDRKYMDIKKDDVTVDVKTSKGNIVDRKEELLKELAGRRGRIDVADYAIGFDVEDGVYKYRWYEPVPGAQEFKRAKTPKVISKEAQKAVKKLQKAALKKAKKANKNSNDFVINENVYIRTCGEKCRDPEALFIAMRDRNGVNAAIKILKDYGHEVIV